MLKCLMEKVDNLHDVMGNTSRDLETVIKIEMVLKKPLDVLKRILGSAEESINEYRLIEKNLNSNT